MKFKLILITLLLLFSSCFAKTKIKIIEIYDGDTIKAKINQNEFSIRLTGVDCFETYDSNRAYKQAHTNNLSIEEVIKQGKIAKKYVKNLYNKSSKNAYFEFQGIDKYSRALGILYFDDLNINEELKNQNICPTYKYLKN